MSSSATVWVAGSPSFSSLRSTFTDLLEVSDVMGRTEPVTPHVKPFHSACTAMGVHLPQ